jgi:hypothetical protein
MFINPMMRRRFDWQSTDAMAEERHMGTPAEPIERTIAVVKMMVKTKRPQMIPGLMVGEGNSLNLQMIAGDSIDSHIIDSVIANRIERADCDTKYRMTEHHGTRRRGN